MTEFEAPPSEAELHGYVDGQLGLERRAAVERHLAEHPDAARRVASDISQRSALRAAFAGYAAQPLPPEVNLSRLIEQRLRRRHVPWQVAAAIALSLGIGGAGGWLLHTPTVLDRPARAMALLQEEALASHVVYSADPRHAVEVSAGEREQLVQWLSNRLGRTVAPPDLASFGFVLIGGRLLATEQGNPAALFIYENGNSNRMSLLMRPMTTDLQVPITDWDRGDVNACSWIGKGMGYALLGAVPDEQLDRIARHISTLQG